MIRILIGCYRRADFSDPEVFAQAAQALLMAYPRSVVVAVMNPVTGIASRLQWPPSIAEIKQALEAEDDGQKRRAKAAQLPPVLPRLAAPASTSDDKLAEVKRQTDEICRARGIADHSLERRRVHVEVLRAIFPDVLGPGKILAETAARYAAE